MSSSPFGDAAGGLYEYEGYHGGFAGGHGLGQPGRAPASSVLLEEGETDAMDAAAAATAMEMTKKNCAGDREDKAAMALKSHSEAERRRRERINAHLATLRTLVPCTDKMDKAALLAEVVGHVKKLKSAAARVGRRAPVPSGADEVAVDEAPAATGGGGEGSLLLRATLSCDDRADLFVDVKRALQPLGLEVVGSEVTTLGGRVRLTFLVSCGSRDAAAAAMASLHHALQSVLDKASSGFDFAPRASSLLGSKRRKVSSMFESSSSSS